MLLGEETFHGIPPTMSTSPHRRAILLLSFAAFAAGSSMRICDPLLPEFARAFDVSASLAALSISAFALTYGLMQAFYGPMGDHLGKYKVIALAALAGVVGNLVALAAPSLPWLVAGRILNGATAAALIPLSMAWIGDHIDYTERQTTLARFLSGQILGLIAGQALGGLLADTLGWRWCFGFLAGIYLLVGLALLRESRANPEAPAAGKRPAFGKQLRSVLALPWVRVILVTVFVESVAVFSVLAFVPSHLHLHFGLSLAAAGAIPATFGLGGLGYAFLARRAVAHLGERGLILGGGTSMVVAGLLLAAAPHWGWALPAAFLLGAGFYMFHNTLQTHATQMAPAQRGTAVSLFASAFFLGQFTGVAAASRMAESWGHRPAFALAALIAAGVTVWFSRRLAGRVSAP